MIKTASTHSWQIKTIDGTYFQPPELNMLLQWILECRIGAQDLVYSPKERDWVPLFMAPELSNCFWKLKDESGKVYGPLSAGELKQLMESGQVSLTDIVSIWGREQWTAINGIPSLCQWLKGEYIAGDYGELIASFSAKPKKLQREEKRKVVVQTKQIKELEDARRQLEIELQRRQQVLEEVSNKYTSIEPQYEATVKRLNDTGSSLRERETIINELNERLLQLEAEGKVKENRLRELSLQLEGSQGDLAIRLADLQRDIQAKEELINKIQAERVKLERTAFQATEVLQTKIVEQREDCKVLRKEIDEQKVELDKYHSGKSTADNSQAELIGSQEEIIVCIQKERDALLEEINALNLALSDKDTFFSTGQEEERQIRENLSAEKSELQDRIEMLHEQISNLHREKEGVVQSLRNNITRLEEENFRRREELTRLEAAAGEREGNVEDKIAQLSQEKDSLQEAVVAQQKAFSLLGEEKEAVQQECARLRDEVKQKLSELTVIRDGAADNNLEIGNIQGQLAGVEKDLALKGAQIKSLLGNKDELLKEIESRGREIHVLERDSTQKLGSLTEQFRLREGLIDDLEQKLEQLENEFVVKRKEWQEQLAAVKADSEREISQQVTAFQQELNGKGESWNIQQQQLRQELESEIALRDGQLAGRQVEVDGLREELTNKELQWQRRMAEEEQQAAEKINELAAAGENFRQESERKSAEWTGEQESLRQELAQLRSLSEQSQSEGQRLANELRQREQFIQTIKEEAERQENIYRTELAGKDEQLTALARRMQEMEADGARVREERESLNGQLNNAQQELDQFRSLLEQKKLAEQRLAEEVEQRVQELETNSAKLREERDGFAGQLNNSRQELVQLQARHDESLNNIRGLEGELVQREQFMQNLEKESQQKEEHYRQEISNKERQLEDSYRQAAELQDQINSLNGSIQELRDARSRLEEEKTNLGDELSGARREMEQSLHEKGNLLHDVERERESFQEQKAQWEQELEELRGNWEHVVEENRALQKQSYQEKQKLIREYTETINKQARLEKRSQLEREVNDRIRVKSELERLSSFLQDNLSSLQRGTKEIETSMEQLQSEIDNKNLSLKHISEADKRDAKKNTFSFKAEPVDNTTPEVLSE